MSNEVKRCIITHIDIEIERYHDLEAQGKTEPDKTLDFIRSKIREYEAL